MNFAKYVNEKRIIPCPRNGYVGGKAVSNLKRYFERNPMAAEKEGYMQLQSIEGVFDGNIYYTVEDGKIVERIEENDN